MLRKQFIGLSVLSFFSLLTKKVFGDTIEKPKMTTLKHFFSCEESASPNTFQGYFPFSLDPYFAQNWLCEAVDSPPTGFIELLDSNGVLYGYTVIGAAAGTYNITIQAANFGGEYTQFNLEFVLQGECAVEQEIECCDESTTIKWLGVEGGIKQWSFPGVRFFKNTLGDANTFKNNSRQIQYSERKNIYAGKRVTSGDIELEQRNFLEELSETIQAWEVNEDGENIPILIANDSFPEYSSRDKFFDLGVQFIYATEKQIQTQ